MKIKNPASRVFYFQSIRAVDIGTMDNTKMRSIALMIYLRTTPQERQDAWRSENGSEEVRCGSLFIWGGLRRLLNLRPKFVFL